MGLFDGGLRNAIESVVPGIRLSRLRAEFPVPMIEKSEEFSEHLPVRDEAAQLTIDADLDGVLRLLRAQLDGRQTSITGLRYSEITLETLYSGFDLHGDDPRMASQLLQPFKDWYARSGDNPDVAALVARAIQIVGHIHRGDDWAHRTSRQRWQALAEHLDEAEAMLVCSRAAGKTSELWHRTRFRGGLNECIDPLELQARFEQFREFDPGNFLTYYERAFQLLPRWHGSFEELEHFALQSVERTRDQYGAAMYWGIYCDVAQWEDILDTHADWQLLKRGYKDAKERFVPILEMNKLIDMAARMGDDAMVRRLFENLPELRLDVWQDSDHPFEVYGWAYGQGAWPHGPEGWRTNSACGI